MSKSTEIVQVFKDWLDGFAELNEWEQDKLIGESEWYALEMQVLKVLTAPKQKES